MGYLPGAEQDGQTLNEIEETHSLDDIARLVEYDEFGQPIPEALPFRVFRPTRPDEITSNADNNQTVRNFYADKRPDEISEAMAAWLRGEKWVRPTREKVTVRCGLEIWAKNKEAHEQHCPRCKETDES